MNDHFISHNNFISIINYCVCVCMYIISSRTKIGFTVFQPTAQFEFLVFPNNYKSSFEDKNWLHGFSNH